MFHHQLDSTSSPGGAQLLLLDLLVSKAGGVGDGDEDHVGISVTPPILSARGAGSIQFAIEFQ